MRIPFLYLLIHLFCSAAIHAQGLHPYSWEESRSRIKLADKEKELSEIILKNHAEFDFGFEKEQYLLQTVVHKIIYVNNSEAIQKHNRIMISISPTSVLVDLKARAINKDGKVSVFDRTNLKELKEEETNKAYQIFAIEGVELGSEIEYYYVIRGDASIYDRVFMQSDVLTKTASFVLRCPNHLKYDFRSYNDFPEVKLQIVEEEHIYTAELNDVPPLLKEGFSYFDSNRKRIEFKLAYNTARSQARMYTWDDAAKRFFSVMNDNNQDDEKALSRYIKSINDNPGSPIVSRIKNVEQKIKSTIALNTESNDPKLSSMTSIVKSNVASKSGMAKLFFSVYSRLMIPCSIVLTGNRQYAKFDGGFDSWNFLDDYFLFFPETKGFLAPYDLTTRYPLIPASNTDQDGLFIEPIKIGGVSSALGSIQKIPAPDFTLNTDNLVINVSFDEELAANKIHLQRSLSGYNASFIIPYIHMLTEAQLRTLTDGLIKQTAPDNVITKWSAKPDDNSESGKFDFEVDFSSAHFLESAGHNVLFKIGELIGPQTELYSEVSRTTAIENDFNRGYDRILVINIPPGYSIKNPEVLKFDIVYNEESSVPFLFQSDYELKENVLTVKIKEYYKQISAPLSRYEDYRKVINAAADFNKVTLVLERRK